ncbi:MAG: hypothetical protein OSA93_02315 [Akkermansiaceae bacterium]|nr:hypothetical protein [Akkermansiaceae bacterium]
MQLFVPRFFAWRQVITLSSSLCVVATKKSAIPICSSRQPPPPFAPVQGQIQGPPAKRKFLAVSMKEESKNHALATKLSNRGAGLFLAGILLSLLLLDPGIGGITLISSFFLGVIACCLGISAKNTRAIIVGAVPAILVIVFMIISTIAMNNGMVVE